MNIVRRLVDSLFGGGGSVRGMRRMSESSFEALTEYDWDTIYRVDGVGVYHGATLIEAEPWAPAAGDLYVATTGDDSDPGTDPEAPKLTIASAFGSISESNTGPITIWVAAGTYAENISATGYFYIVNKTFAFPVTIRAIPGDAVTLTSVSGSYVIFFFGVNSNIKFRNITIASIAASLSVFTINTTGSASDCGVYDCIFSDANSKGTAVNASGTGGTENLSIKRCVFTSASTFNCATGNTINVNVIGNTMTGTALGGISATAGTMSTGGTYRINSNRIPGAITLNGSSSILTADVLGNTCRNVVHTGGAGGNESILRINRNTISSTTTFGINIGGYTIGGECRSNTITTTNATVGLAWPTEGVAQVCSGHTIANNTITNNQTNGHGLLIGVGGSEVSATNNTMHCDDGGAYGLVLKGLDCTVTGNVVYGGRLYPLLLKGARECAVTGNTIYSDDPAVLAALRFSVETLDSTTPAEDNTVTGNTFVITEGDLYEQSAAEIGDGNIVDANTYDISENGAWGSLLGTAVSSLAEVRAQWAADYPTAPTNDANSVEG